MLTVGLKAAQVQGYRTGSGIAPVQRRKDITSKTRNTGDSPYFVVFRHCGTLADSQGLFPEEISALAGRSKSGLHLRWTTVTYSSVAVVLLCIAIIAGFVLYLVAPVTFQTGTNAIRNLISRGVAKLGATSSAKTNPSGPQQAKFTAIDGTVKVKKANSNSWVAANFELALEKGDVVQTSSEGMAKIVFSDLTNYTIKPDSLIVIEENSANAAQQTEVRVQLTTGTVDLSTGTYSQGSRSEVVVSGATAALAPQSAAMVKNDPRGDEHQVLVKSGSAQVRRGSETLPLGPYEGASFTNDAPIMTKTKELSPPTLITPANIAPIFVAPGSKSSPVEFAWTPVDLAHSYLLRISQNPYFSSTVFDQQIETTGKKLSLSAGAYYWLVQSVDVEGRVSTESEHNRFTVIVKAPEAVSIMLELEPLVVHGRVIEIKGRTEPNAKVLINNNEVPYVKPDGSFSFFTPRPLPPGENMITITAQNARGGVKTKQEKVVIQ